MNRRVVPREANHGKRKGDTRHSSKIWRLCSGQVFSDTKQVAWME